MKRRNPTSGQIGAALRMYAGAAPARPALITGQSSIRPSTGQPTDRELPGPERVARVWRVHWLQIQPTDRRYQEPVCLARVLGEHHAAVAAEPIGD